MEQRIEIWKDIPNYEGYYQVSNFGRVMSLRSYGGNSHRIMKQCGNGTGYLKVMLCKNSQQKQYLVHRLVAMAFIPNPNNYDFVNHKDENKTNNSLENLRWASRKTQSYNRENREYKYKGVVCLNDWKSFNSCQEAEEYYGLTKNTVSRVARVERKSIHGLKFCYQRTKERLGRELAQMNLFDFIGGQ